MAIIIAERPIVVRISSVESVDQNCDEHQQEKDDKRDVPQHSLPATDFEIFETNDSCYGGEAIGKGKHKKGNTGE